MDDIYILSNDKEYLVYCFDKIKYELNKIELNINNKSGIYRLKDGVVFLGYTYNLTNNKLFVRYDNNTIKMIRRKLKYLYDNDFDYYYRSISSYKGYFIRCNTNFFLINIIIYVLIVIMISIGSLKKNIMDILYLLKLRIGIILMTMIYCI